MSPQFLDGQGVIDLRQLGQHRGPMIIQPWRSSSAPAIEYDLKALFTASDQTFTDGQVLDSAAEGIETGSLTVVDTSSGSIEILSDELKLVGPDIDDIGVYKTTGITTTIGQGIFDTVEISNNTNTGFILALRDAGGLGNANRIFQVSTDSAGVLKLIVWDGSENLLLSVVLCAYPINTKHKILILQGGFDSNGIQYKIGDTKTNFTYGASIFIKGGAFSSWTLLYNAPYTNIATLYPGISQHANTGLHTNLLIPDYDFSAVLQPTVLDTFTDVDSTSLDAHTMDVGDGWTEQIGDWDIQGNKANPSLTESVISIATCADLKADIHLTVTGTTGEAATASIFCCIFRYTDTSNYWKATVQTNSTLAIQEMNAGTNTVRAINSSIIINDNTEYTVKVIANGQTIDCFLDDANKLTYTSAALNETATTHGIGAVDEGLRASYPTISQFSIHPITSSVYESAFAAGTDSIY